MQHKKLKIALVLCTVLLAAELIFLGVMFMRERGEATLSHSPYETDGTLLSQQTDPSGDPTENTTESTRTTESTQDAESTQPEETEPGEQRYVLTFVGDCTLASSQDKYQATGSFIQTVGQDYDYPFRNVAQFFENDDFTMVNLESVLADEGKATGGKTFTFKGPTAYTQILTGSSVEAVTLANNHTEDYGVDGYASTTAALDHAGVPYVEKDGALLFTTESGLTIGVYAATFKVDEEDMRMDIADLRARGAEIVVCAFHWGTEGSYRPNAEQQKYGHAAIDAGADIVYGSHPHVLQRIEEYNGGIIYYSLGNFSFGGNHFPRDMDSVIVRQEVIRREDGTLELGELELIPVSISSMKNQNNFQPTPYEPGSKEYDRTLTKLDGTWTGADLVVDYSFLDPTEPTEPTGATEPGSNGGGDDAGQSGGSSATQPSQGGDTGDASTEVPIQPPAELPEDSGSSGGTEGSSGGTEGSSGGTEASPEG